jgi:hypothetical protein
MPLTQGRRKNIICLLPEGGFAMGALNIKDKDVAEKARRLARLKGTTITEAVSAALEESLLVAEHRVAAGPAERMRRIEEAIDRINAAIPPDAPSWEDVMADMYDENGLPK